MENIFKFEVINPEKIIFSEDVKMVTFPSYEGDMSILKNHISIITFLRPGIIKAEKSDESKEEFFVEDGTVEFFDNNLVILSISARNVKNLSKDFLDNLREDTEKELTEKNISDQNQYILNHKLNVIKNIRV